MDITFLKDVEAAEARREEALWLLDNATRIGVYETRADGSSAGSPSFFRQLGIAPQPEVPSPNLGAMCTRRIGMGSS